MGSIGNPQTWAPYGSIRDCSQGICSIYCPQWCYIVYPPPPPLAFQPEDPSGANFSPLVIAIIGILASAFLLVSYYTIVSKYCGNFDSSGRRSPGRSGEEPEGTQSPDSEGEAWQAGGTGLDESLIKSITVCKYKKGDGLVMTTDCSVCLSEFLEDESLRLLPKCSHAFHVPCIDTWLKSHTNCPLCRAYIVPTSPPPLQSPPPAIPSDPRPANRQRNDHTCVRIEELEMGQEEVSRPKPAVENRGAHLRARDSVIEITHDGAQTIRRSVSMDPSYRDRVLIAHVPEISIEEDEFHMKDQQLSGGEGSSKSSEGMINRGGVLNSVTNPVAMTRSASSGQLFFSTRHGRGRSSDLPG